MPSHPATLFDVIENRERDIASNRERQRRFRERHPERARMHSRNWAQRHPEKHNAKSDRYMARLAAAPGHATRKQLKARAALYDFRCYLCGAHVGDRPIMDHVKPLTAGGSNWPANRRPVCRPCNSRKGHQWKGPEGVARLREEYGR